MQFHESFRAMDTDVDVLVEDQSPPFELFVSARRLFEQQEQRFSRFRATSLLSQLNRGEPVDDPTFAAACRLALEAHRLTAGLYNPMILPALRDAGYDRTFAAIGGGRLLPHTVPDPALCLTFAGDTVRLNSGALDFGGLAKGWTVDLCFGAFGGRWPNLLINAGGDLRCTGYEANREGWLVQAASPRTGAVVWEGAITGAMATSTSLKRRWRTASGEPAHHLIDPRTGLPAESPLEQVTVWASETWLAEVWAKAALIGGIGTADACRAAGNRLMAFTSSGGTLSFGM